MPNLSSSPAIRHRLRRLMAALMIAGIGISLSGCVVYPARPGGWCYWHPYRCR